MTRNRILITCAIASLTLGLSACSSDDGPATMMPGAQMEVGKVVPTGTTITLPAGLADDETFTAAEGEPVNIEDVGDFECASAICTVDIADNVLTVTGDIKVVSLADDLPDDVLAALTDAFKELVELTPLEAAKTAAADAATAAMTAAVTAGEAAAAADTARENAATMQTGGTSGGHAEMARTYATAAHTAYMAAKAASGDAAAAEDVTAAVEARVKAEIAMADAVDAEAEAVKHAGFSMAAARGELLIDGTVKTVGDTSIDAEAAASVVTTDDNTVATGRLANDLQPMHMAALSPGVLGVSAVPNENPDDVVAYVAPVAGVEARTFAIGKLVDSADDMARLMIVTQYAGTKTVKVYASDGMVDANSIRAGTIQFVGFDTGDDATDDVFRDLKPVGTYYLAGDLDGVDNDELVTAETEGDEVAKGTKPKQVYSYDATPVDDEVTLPPTYVVLLNHIVEDGVTTYRYSNVTIRHAMIDRDGDEATLPNTVEVTAKIPEATDYAHIHFGVWAALGAAAEDGTQATLADLGIGFVQNWSGEGLTSIGGGKDDMPNGGDATFVGNWVAAVRAADEDGNGAISLVNGPATLVADFGKGDITATLTWLATLTGKITEDKINTFSGTKATVAATNQHSLTGGADFTGTFGGGFYGAKAAEAGGVFDFTSTDKEDGEFRGAFGGAR